MNRFVVQEPETKRGFYKVRRERDGILRETVCMTQSELWADIISKTLNDEERVGEDAFDAIFKQIMTKYSGPINPIRDNLISILSNLRKGLRD